MVDNETQKPYGGVDGHCGAVICMALFGADNFMIPSLIAMLVMFIMLRPYLDDLKPDDVGKRDDADGAVESAADRNEVGEARS